MRRNRVDLGVFGSVLRPVCNFNLRELHDFGYSCRTRKILASCRFPTDCRSGPGFFLHKKRETEASLFLKSLKIISIHIFHLELMTHKKYRKYRKIFLHLFS
jgi:hypothetical protein